MALERDIILPDGATIRMRASALIPRLYRIHFRSDLIRDLTALQASADAVRSGEQEFLGAEDLTVFENIAWIMARHADSTVPNSPDEWLDGIDHALDLYEILPQIMELLSANTATTSVPAKK